MFLSPIMLVFAGAALLPLILHLLSRSRQTEVRFSAMMFLGESSPRRSRLQRLRELLLLSLRCLAVLALVLAMARPVAGLSPASLTPPGRAAVVFVVDTSGSTGAPTGPGAVRLDQIREVVGGLLASLPENDVATLLVDEIDPLFTADRSALLARLSALRPQPTGFDLPGALERAARLLAAQGAPHRIILVVTDRQASSAADLTPAFAARFARVRDEVGIQRILIYPCGDADRDNVSVREIELLDAPVLEGRPGRVRVTLRNDGSTPRPAFPVRLRVGSADEVTATVDLAADAEGSAVVPMTFPAAGRAVVFAEIAPSGPSFDDRLLRVVDVGQPMRVLVVDPSSPTGARSGPPALALAPLASVGRSGDAIVVESTAQFPRFELERFAVVVIPQLQTLSAEDAVAIRQYVHGGGGLVVGVGPLTPTAAVQQLAGPSADFLPAEVGNAVEPGMGTASTGGGGKVALDSPSHPIARLIASPGDVFPGASVSRYRELSLASDAVRVLRLDPTMTLVAERSFGRGRVVLSGIPLEGFWSDITRSVGYVPWMQALVRHAALPPPDAVNLRVGEVLSVPLRTGADLSSVVLVFPGGGGGGGGVGAAGSESADGGGVALSPIQTHAGSVVRFGPLRQPGLYALRYRLLEGDPAAAWVSEAVYVRPPESESDLRADDAAWERAAERLGARRVDPTESSSLGDLRHGRELWLEVLLLAAVMLLAEVTLARAWRV